MKAKRALIALNAVLAAILACNLPSSQRPLQPPGGVATDTPAEAVLQDTNTPAPIFTETPSVTPTITLTPTPTIPQVSVSAATNCRTGPGTVYDLLYTLQPGPTAEVVGKETPHNYWIIKMPNGATCWLWGQYATVSGNWAALPDWPVPPTPTPALPADPSTLKVQKTCTLVPAEFRYLVHAELSWQDNATNESGYYVFRNDTKIATLGANESSFGDDAVQLIAPPPGSAEPITYTVQAFNDAGKSRKISKSITCY